MIRWAGWLIALYGAAHTIGALAVEGAAQHAGAWFSGALWGEAFSDMSPAHSALWFSLDSFGPPLTLIGATVVWLDRRGVTPPLFLAWVLAILTLVDGTILLFTPWPVLLAACIMLFIGIKRSSGSRGVNSALSR